jgi:carbamoyl-phosphate synthase large subunit
VILRGVGIETGGCNIQFTLDPHSDQFYVIEMNPRVSRSSALASKATGFPVAKLAALVALGYSLDEIQNDITKKTPASFEPALDYVVVKIPRFAFEKFRQTEPLLGTQMKSVGEVMAIGRTFKEAFQKAFNSLELGNHGLSQSLQWKDQEIKLETVRAPRFDRWWLIAQLLRQKKSTIQELNEATGIDLWFLKQLEEIIETEDKVKQQTITKIPETLLATAKEQGFSDEVIADLLETSSKKIRDKRHSLKIHPTLNQVDTCAGEFEAVTPYYYFSYEANSSYEDSDSIRHPRKRESVVILGSGPNRIGQGVEFDYSCVKAAQAVQEMGYDAVMVNSNPETVSTDYDTSNRLYFEPMTEESIRVILFHEKENLKGVLCQTGGQTALRLSQQLRDKPLLGTTSEQIDRAEDRGKFDRLLTKLKLKRPKSRFAKKLEDLPAAAKSLGFPVLIRPSYVLGGRSMVVVRSAEQLQRVMNDMMTTQDIQFPLLVDRFLDDAIEIDVDCIGDADQVIVIAVMEHIEEAGIHSGDSSCSIPSLTLSDRQIEQIRKQSEAIGRELNLCGFLNIQFAILDDEIYVLEVNPRASRTLPFVCKATGVNWVRPAVV